MKILSIDPGIGKCGVAVLEVKGQKEKGKTGQAKELKLIFADCIETDKKLPMEKRLQELKEGLEHLIEKYKPQEVAVEELFFAKNVKTALLVAQARGAILLESAEKNLPVFEYQPLEVKMALTGYGRATKKQVQEMVKLTLGGETIVQDDTADAVAVAICHLQTQKFAPITRISPQYRPKEKQRLLYPELSYRIVGILQQTYNKLGFNYQERYYYRAINKALEEAGISYQHQLPIKLNIPHFRGNYWIDYLIEGKIVLEIKIGARISKQNVDQLMAYLRATKCELGILAYFNRGGVMTKRFLRGFN